jgi:hypothetical protein
MKIRNSTTQPKALRAVHDNPGVMAWYSGQLRAALYQSYLDAVGIITEAWNEAPPTVGIAMDSLGDLDPRIVYFPPHETGLIDDTGNWIEATVRTAPGVWKLAYDAPSSTVKLHKALKKWGDKWRGKFDKLSDVIAKKFASRSFVSTEIALKAALRDAGFTVSFKVTPKVLESYKLVVAENVGLIRNLQASYYNKIQQDVWASVRAGADMHTLSRKLQDSYGIEEKRAALISRDQNAKAKAVLETTRRQELGISQAIWQHSAGGKEPRPVHVAWGREGKVFDLNKGLFDPDEGEWIFPGQLINCRCTSRAIIPGINDEGIT